MDEGKDAHPRKVLREAFVALQDAHPELVVKLADAMQSTRDNNSQLVVVEAGFRDAAKAIFIIDRGAAQTLFTLADVLAQTTSERLK